MKTLNLSQVEPKCTTAALAGGNRHACLAALAAEVEAATGEAQDWRHASGGKAPSYTQLGVT